MVDPILIANDNVINGSNTTTQDDEDSMDDEQNKNNKQTRMNEDDATEYDGNCSTRLLKESILASKVIEDSVELQYFDTNKLLLEPNAVPMLILLSLPNPLWNTAAMNNVAKRHGDTNGPYGLIPVVHLDTVSSTSLSSSSFSQQQVGQGINVSSSIDHFQQEEHDSDNTTSHNKNNKVHRPITSNDGDSSSSSDDNCDNNDAKEALVVIEKWIDEIL
jgi:hypothetical protein